MIENIGTIKKIGDIPLYTLNTDYIRIENLQQYMHKILRINPLNEINYIEYWQQQKKIVTEGLWGQESQGYRYMPGALYFYGNYTLIQDTDESKVTTYIKPTITDLEWEIFYGLMEAEGFSGYYDDDMFTSDELIFTYNKKFPETFRERQLFNSKGEKKRYITPRENIRKLHKKPKGVPLWFNEAKNYLILGSRGGGKSYSVALGKALHQIVTDGANYYNNGDFYTLPDYQEIHDNTLVEIVVGSGDTDKSSEFLNKIKASMNVLAINPAFGVWGEPGDEDYTPNPLYKDMAGSLSPGNKKNPWRHEYKVVSKGRETYDGTNSKIYHVSYSAQKAKGKGAQAAAGGRTKYSIVEETGLTQNAIDVYNSNNNIVARNGVQFGVQCFLGTSGNIDAIQQTKRMFLNPQDYNIVAYKDSWEGMGKDGMIGFFLPAYLTYRQFKDKDGNTDFAKAFEHVYRNRKRFSSSDASVIREEKMNRPIVPSEMWLQSKGYYLPYEEGVTREKALIKNNAYLDLALPVTLSFDSYQPNGVAYKIDNKADPFYNFPIDSTKTSHEGSIVIYDLPKFDAPNDFYFFTHDPYVSENIDNGGSLGVTHGFISPKYWNEYMPPSGPMVCTYIGKPEKGLSQYYLNQEKLIQFYGNPVRGLAYEANKGSDCKNYYMNKNKEYLLTLRPVVHDSKRIYSTRVNEYGYVVGNKMDKLVKLKRLNDWLLEELPNGLRFIETLPCLFSTKQIVAYELDGNFDAVSSMIMGAVHVGILESQLQTEAIKKREKNELVFFSQNKIFNENGNDFKRSRFNHHWPK